MDELTAQFAELFHFTAEDLALNRSGSLSETQHENLRQKYRRNVFLFALFSGAFPITAIVLVRLRIGGIPPGLPLFIALTMPVLGLWLIWVWLSYRRKLAALRTQLVETASGILRIEQKPHGNRRFWYAVIGSSEFSLSVGERKFLTSKQGKWVSAYFIPKLRQLVSLETVQ
jgi:hypothetical protein